MIGTYLLLGIIMSIVTICDLRHFRIPNGCSLLLACFGAVYSMIMNQKIIDCILGCMSMSVPLIVLYVFTHKKVIGGGDIKLLAASGILLGWRKNVIAFLISGVCLWVHILRKPEKFYRGRKVALGPYLSIGILTSFIAGDFLVKYYHLWTGISFL